MPQPHKPGTELLFSQDSLSWVGFTDTMRQLLISRSKKRDSEIRILGQGTEQAIEQVLICLRVPVVLLALPPEPLSLLPGDIAFPPPKFGLSPDESADFTLHLGIVELERLDQAFCSGTANPVENERVRAKVGKSSRRSRFTAPDIDHDSPPYERTVNRNCTCQKVPGQSRNTHLRESHSHSPAQPEKYRNSRAAYLLGSNSITHSIPYLSLNMPKYAPQGLSPIGASICPPKESPLNIFSASSLLSACT